MESTDGPQRESEELECGSCSDSGPAKEGAGGILAVARWLWRSEFFRSMVFILAVIFLIKGCVVDQYTVPSASMYPTLQGNNNFFLDDRILVNKWLFGPRIPFTTLRLWDWYEPKRWDVVVFKSVQPDSEHDVLVKRLAGLPGERVHISGGHLFINGEAVEPPPELGLKPHYTERLNTPWSDVKFGFLQFVKEKGPLDFFNPKSKGVAQLRHDVERMESILKDVDIYSLTKKEIDDYCHDVAKVSLSLILELTNLQFPPLEYGIKDAPEFAEVPEGHYFMLGDNSTLSLDSRVWGWVPRDHLLGRASAIIWPWKRRHDFTGFSHTWWGKLLIFGIPLLLIASEARHYAVERRRKKGRE